MSPVFIFSLLCWTSATRFPLELLLLDLDDALGCEINRDQGDSYSADLKKEGHVCFSFRDQGTSWSSDPNDVFRLSSPAGLLATAPKSNPDPEPFFQLQNDDLWSPLGTDGTLQGARLLVGGWVLDDLTIMGVQKPRH